MASTVHNRATNCMTGQKSTSFRAASVAPHFESVVCQAHHQPSFASYITNEELPTGKACA
eukprot:365569-Chlamydomonas_euryale.AAC.24